MDKNTDYSSKGRKFGFLVHNCLFETAVPGDSMTSFGLCKYCMRIVHKPYMQAKILVHTKLKSKKRKK